MTCRLEYMAQLSDDEVGHGQDYYTEANFEANDEK